MTYPYGPRLSLQRGGLRVALDVDDHKFGPVGQGNLYEAGFDMFQIQDENFSSEYSLTGYSHVSGPSYPVPYQFAFSFQRLTTQEWADLVTIWKISKSQKGPVLFRNARIALIEIGRPRTRAAVTGIPFDGPTPTISGGETFWPIFEIDIDPQSFQWTRDRTHDGDTYRVAFTAREWNPAVPLPITQDSVGV